MRSSLSHRINVPPSIYAHFKKSIALTWKETGFPQRLGLAISGGVDSMALASLCSQYMRTISSAPIFTAFIVDHGLRRGSSQEAAQVADVLQKLQIEAQILKLDWTTHSDPSALSNVETVARRLRYQALGRACYASGVRSLLVAHHADDQAETVLLRLIGQYTGAGLQGIRPSTRIPECQGIYGVDASGEPRAQQTPLSASILEAIPMGIEGGGVRLLRPLLPFTKQELIGVCESNDIEWFEDQTNADRTLTARNTVRHLQSQGSFPAAFERKRLVALADSLQTQTAEVEAQTEDLAGQMRVELNLALCKATCVYTPDLTRNSQGWKQERLVKAVLLRRLISLVSPKQDVPLQKLRTIAEALFESDHKAVQHQMGGTIIDRQVRDARVVLTLRREPPYSKWARESMLHLRVEPTEDRKPDIPAWSHWQLWDNRYWIRVGHFGSEGNETDGVFVRFLTSTDISAVRRSLDASSQDTFEHALSGADAKTRSTLPVLILQSTAGTKVVALPSLSWSRSNWMPWTSKSRHSRWRDVEWVWDIRYRSTTFGSSKDWAIT